MKDKSLRGVADQALEIRAAAGGDEKGATIVGYAAVFNQETDIGGYFREQIAPGAFKDALAVSDIHALYNHNYDRVLGRAKSGTLRLKEDSKGLKVEIDLPDTTEANDLAAQIERGDIDEMSFGFRMKGGAEEWDETGDVPLRTIKKVGELFDVSVCPRGAYSQTECGLRTFEQREKEKRAQNFTATQRRLRMKLNLGVRKIRLQENG